RQMHEENRAVLELELDDQPLDAFVEVVEALSVHVRSREESIPLLADDRQPLIQRADPVLALVHRIVTERFADRFGLVDPAAADRARVDLDEGHDVRLLGLDELDDALQVLGVADQIADAGQRPVDRLPESQTVTDVIEKQAHAASLPDVLGNSIQPAMRLAAREVSPDSPPGSLQMPGPSSTFGAGSGTGRGRCRKRIPSASS